MAKVRVLRPGGNDPFQGLRVAGLVFGIVVALLLVSSTYYQVASDEVGVVTRFGKYVRTTEPGLHFKWPWVESVFPVETRHVFKEEFGIQPARMQRSREVDRAAESIMLTGDLSAADVKWIVQYRVADPRSFLFRIRDPHETLRDLSQSVMSAVVGDRSVDEVLTVGREDINNEVHRKMQEALDEYETGLRVELVQLQTVDPPDEKVKAALDNVNRAEQEKQRAVNEAMQEYNRRIPQAEGRALRAIQEAEGYRIDRVNRARGRTARFLAVLEEYRKAPEVTRRRLYLETMAEVLPTLGPKIVIDAEVKSALPLLELGPASAGEE